jgi:hypothetical protein
MQYLVTGEWVEVGALLPPDQVATIIENVVLPSFDVWMQWENEGVLQGGVFAGERAGAFILEAASHEEVGERLASLPFWGMVKWNVRPLQSVRSTADRERKVVEQIKANL